MRTASRRWIAVFAYFAYSAFWGVVVLKSIRLNARNPTDLVLTALAGPSIGLSGGHGAELWLFASLFAIPLLCVIVTREASTRSRQVCAGTLAILWAVLGLPFV